MVKIVACTAVLLLVAVALLVRPSEEAEFRRQAMCKDNLKFIALALNNYHDDYGTFPPAYLPDESGHPAHSWRVLILPYMHDLEECKALYDRYRFDEPWDGPHNRKLHSSICYPYQCPSFTHANQDWEHAAVLTNYVLIDSPRSVFELGRCTSIDEITDNHPETILVAEVRRHSVHWLAPHDVSAHELLSDLRFTANGNDSSHKGLQFASVDCSVHLLDSSLDADTFHALVTRNGREPLADF